MIRRILTWGLPALAVAVAGAGVLAWAFRDDLAYRLLAPSMNYSDARVIREPVYLFTEQWAAYPGRNDLADIVPDGAGVTDNQATAKADVFYVHPATYFGAEWNAGPHTAAAEALDDGPLMALNASLFNGCCRVFAPRYRQAHDAALARPTANGANALSLAYADVSRAFESYMREENNRRPFIIAGSGQGALLAMQVIEDLVDTAAARQNFVAAYLVGAGVPLDRFGTNWKNVKACTTATDTGCVVAWETYIDGADPARSPNAFQVWYDRRWHFLADTPRLCTNPLSWTKDGGHADASLHLGAVPMSMGFGPVRSPMASLRFLFGRSSAAKPINPADFAHLPTPIPEYTWAECRGGFLFVAPPPDAAFSTVRKDDGNLHMYDFALFYMNVRQNAQDRVAAFLKARG